MLSLARKHSFLSRDRVQVSSPLSPSWRIASSDAEAVHFAATTTLTPSSCFTDLAACLGDTLARRIDNSRQGQFKTRRGVAMPHKSVRMALAWLRIYMTGRRQHVRLAVSVFWLSKKAFSSSRHLRNSFLSRLLKDNVYRLKQRYRTLAKITIGRAATRRKWMPHLAQHWASRGACAPYRHPFEPLHICCNTPIS